MKLYHATPTANVEAILKNGLKPYAQLSDNGAAIKAKGLGHPNYVWFAATPELARWITHRRGDADLSVLVVELEELAAENLRPSFIYLARTVNWQWYIPVAIAQAVAQISDPTRRYQSLCAWFGQNDHKWRDQSRAILDKSGEIAHDGVVPPSLIKEVFAMEGPVLDPYD